MLKENKDNENENNIELRRSKRLKLSKPVSFEKYLLTAELFHNSVPSSFEEIKTRLDKNNFELDSHLENKTWSIVEKPSNKNIFNSRWIFTIKHNELGNPIRYKARLLAKGFTQQYLTDYDATFAPVARITSFRFILSFSNQYNLLVHHMDVKTAFLNGIIKEEIYMKIPEGLYYDQNKVCKLNKAIYGLKQAARCWFEVFDKAKKNRGFINSEVDRCIYILDRKHIQKNIYVLLYVDDIIIATACLTTLTKFKNYSMESFKKKDFGEIKHFIGIRIERTNNKLCLSQSAYIKNVLEKFNMSECKPVDSPIAGQLDYNSLNNDEIYDAPCRNVIGCIM